MTAPAVVLVEDDPALRTLTARALQENGYTVRPCATAPEMWRAMEAGPVDLVLLDIMLPGTSGIDLCRALRRESEVPIIFISAKGSETDRVVGLELGADDYLPKPFGTRELIARIRAVLRRSEPREEAPAPVMKIDGLEIDSAAMQLRVRGELVVMTATEFRLLEYLARHPGRMFSRDHLLDAVWGDSRFVTPRSVDVYVRRIREKIETDPETPRYLKTMRGAGYRFEVPKTAPPVMEAVAVAE